MVVLGWEAYGKRDGGRLTRYRIEVGNNGMPLLQQARASIIWFVAGNAKTAESQER